VCFDIDDTLIFDNSRETPNLQMKHLLEVCIAHGYAIHLVTAREKSDEVVHWTRDQLRNHQINYDTLSLSPKTHRTSMKKVSAWKQARREYHFPVILTIGDQWGDQTTLESESDIRALDELHGIGQPWMILEMKDSKAGRYGLKLLANNYSPPALKS
jgi:hypothetical protein